VNFWDFNSNEMDNSGTWTDHLPPFYDGSFSYPFGIFSSFRQYGIKNGSPFLINPIKFIGDHGLLVIGSFLKIIETEFNPWQRALLSHNLVKLC
jgi:hypothetical protein